MAVVFGPLPPEPLVGVAVGVADGTSVPPPGLGVFVIRAGVADGVAIPTSTVPVASMVIVGAT